MMIKSFGLRNLEGTLSVLLKDSDSYQRVIWFNSSPHFDPILHEKMEPPEYQVFYHIDDKKFVVWKCEWIEGMFCNRINYFERHDSPVKLN